MMNSLKTNLIKTIALTILGNNILEKMLCYLSANKIIRNNLKLRVIPIAYTYALERPEIRIAKLGNYKLYVNICEPAAISLYFFQLHEEPFSAYLVSKLVKKGDICIDVGAHAGSHTFVIADSIGVNGKVFAFEPHPDFYNLLLDSINLNKADHFIFIDKRALWSKSGESLNFYLSQDKHNLGISSLVNHGYSVSEDKYIIVETLTLTDFFREKAIEKCNLLKIDVERAESEVVKGASELLEERRIDYIILEQLAGSDCQKILTSFNYTGWLIDEVKRVLVDINMVENETFGNYLFVSPNLINDFQSKLPSYK